MNKFSRLSEDSKKLIKELSIISEDRVLQQWHIQTEAVLQEELILWLMQVVVTDKKNRFPLESLRTSLLKDLLDSFLTAEERIKQASNSNPKNTNTGSVKFVLLALAGTIVAICEGFDGITTILLLFQSIPLAVTFAIGFAFSIFSVAVFLGLGLREIANNLNVKLQSSPQVLDVFLQQVEQINLLANKIDDIFIDTVNIDELFVLQKMTNMLSLRNQDLDKARVAYNLALNDFLLKVAKCTMATISGILFFGAGFFAGQSLSLAIAGLFITTAIATLLPIILVSIGVGLASLGVYWYSERPEFENLVGCWFGLDENKIKLLTDGDKVIEKRLDQLKHKIAKCLQNEQKINPLNKEDSPHHSPQDHFKETSQSTFSFFKRSKSTSDLSLFERNPSPAL